MNFNEDIGNWRMQIGDCKIIKIGIMEQWNIGMMGDNIS
jgi:subtilisin-like proprotein convertase family protein